MRRLLSTRATLDFVLLLVSMASPRSLLDVRKAPQASDLTRKRKTDSNPPVGQKRSRGQVLVSQSPSVQKSRVNEFLDECLTVSRGGKLFCSACREELSPRKNIITACKKHWTSKEKVRTSKAKDQTIIDSLRIYDAEHHPACVGETLPMSQYVYIGSRF